MVYSIRFKSFLAAVLLFWADACCRAQAAVSETNVVIRVAAANLTSGSDRAYELPGIRIFQGLKPDVVAIQEFNYLDNSAANLRGFVNTAFGTNYHYHREAGNYDIPNGVISRYPILASGSWVDVDTGVNDRGFAWARLDIPGTNDLYVVSIHLKASSGLENSERRYAQATNLVNLVSATFPATAWIVVAGDCNIFDPSEAAYQHLASRFSDAPIPTDAETGGDADTNAGRSERYDYVFSSVSLVARLTATVYGARKFSKGLIFDTRKYVPLNDVAPAQFGDSGVTGMQHMAVLRSYSIPYLVTNVVATAPTILSQPGAQHVAQGADAVFRVQASGTAPLSYQWRRNGVPVAGASQSEYIRTNTQPAHVGEYSVLIANSAGSVLSAAAGLFMVVPAPVLVTAVPGVVSWSGLSNLVYRVETCTNFATGDWLQAGTASSENSRVLFTNDFSGRPGQFFRVVYP